MTIALLVLVFLVLFAFAGLPNWYSPSYRSSYGYVPSGVLFVIVLILIVLLLFGGRF
jgi:hypothetical protein